VRRWRGEDNSTSRDQRHDCLEDDVEWARRDYAGEVNAEEREGEVERWGQKGGWRRHLGRTGRTTRWRGHRQEKRLGEMVPWEKTRWIEHRQRNFGA
jgi:hypothetical protein